MSKVYVKFENVTVSYNKTTGYLYINDGESDEQLAMFCVIDEDQENNESSNRRVLYQQRNDRQG